MRLVLKAWAGIALTACAIAQVRVEVLEKLDAETSEPSLSPDGKTLAFSWCKPDYTCAIYTRPFAGGETKLLVGKDDKDGTPYDPKWSPDGRSLAFTRFYSHYNEHLFVLPLTGGPERDLGQICSGAVSWSPDSQVLATDVH